MSRLLQSSKFWALVLDVVISLVTYFVTKYVAPSAADDVLFVIGSLNAVFIALIGAIAWEDSAAKRAGNGAQP